MDEITKHEKLLVLNEDSFMPINENDTFKVDPKMLYPVGCPYSLQDIMDCVMCETEDYIDK